MRTLSFVFALCSLTQAARYFTDPLEKASEPSNTEKEQGDPTGTAIQPNNTQSQQVDVVAALQQRLNNLVKKKEEFEQEMAAKGQDNSVKLEETKKVVDLQLQKIQEIQAERKPLEEELARLSSVISEKDEARQHEIQALNGTLDVLKVRVEEQERPEKAKGSEEAVLQKMYDEVSQEKSAIHEALLAKTEVKQKVAAEEAAMRQLVLDLQKQRRTLAEELASNGTVQERRSKQEEQLTQQIEASAASKQALEQNISRLSQELEAKREEQKNLADKVAAATSEKQHWEEVDGEKVKFIDEAAGHKPTLQDQLNNLAHEKQVLTKEIEPAQELVNVRSAQQASLEAALLKSEGEVEDAKREQQEKQASAQEKEANSKALQEKLEHLETEREAYMSKNRGDDVEQDQFREQKEEIEAELKQVNQDMEMLAMESSTLGKFAEARAEEQKSLKAHLEEVRANLATLNEDFSVKETSVQATLQQRSDVELNVQKQLEHEEAAIAQVTSERAAVADTIAAKVSEISGLKEQIQKLSGDEEALERNIEGLTEDQAKTAGEGDALSERVSRLREEVAKTDSVMKANKDTDKVFAQKLESLPDKIKDARLKQQSLQTEITNMTVQEELKASQGKMVKEQLDSTKHDKDMLAKAKADEEKPYLQKVGERQALLGNVGGTPSEKAQLHKLSAQIDALNKREENAHKAVNNAKREAEDRDRRVAEAREKFYKTYSENEKHAKEQLERALAEKA